MKSVGFFSAIVLCGTSALGEQESFYVGTYTDRSGSQGIYQASIDSVTGELGPITLAASVADPSFIALSPDEGNLYAVQELSGTGRVQAFRRGADGGLIALNGRSADGKGTCHLSLDPSGRDLLVANYETGSIACFRIQADGAIGDRTSLIPFSGSGPDAGRQRGPHAHCIEASPDDAFVYSCDLGSDRIWIFRFDAARGSLVPDKPPWVQVPPGSGPRHLVFSHDGRFFYVSNELGRSVSVFARDPVTGSLAPMETINLPAAGSGGNAIPAEIALHPGGRWLYVSNRGSDTLSVFAVRPSGRLTLIQNVDAGVKSPRSFAIDPTGRWIIAAGQGDNRIAVLKIDPQSGKLSAPVFSARAASPVCVLFAKRA